MELSFDITGKKSNLQKKSQNITRQKITISIWAKIVQKTVSILRDELQRIASFVEEEIFDSGRL